MIEQGVFGAETSVSDVWRSKKHKTKLQEWSKARECGPTFLQQHVAASKSTQAAVVSTTGLSTWISAPAYDLVPLEQARHFIRCIFCRLSLI